MLRNFQHKVLWAKSLLEKEGSVYLLKQIPQMLFLKREFYILEYVISQLKRESSNPIWTIIKNDFNFLEKIRKNCNLPTEFYFDRIDGCKQFYMVINNNDGNVQPIGICWVYKATDINRILQLGPSHVEIKHVLTLEKFRNQGVFSALLSNVLLDLSSDGYSRIFSVIEINNKASLKVFNRFGFRCIKKWTFYKLFGFRISPLFSTSCINNN